MSKIVSAKIENDIQYKLHYKVPQDEYQTWLQRLTNQYYDTIEVPGFRKGKAPKHLVEQQINTQALEQTLLRESLEKYTQEALIEAQKDLKEKNRIALLTTFSVAQDSVKKEDSFEFILQADLLPEVDFGFLDKIKVARPTKKDLKNRMSKKDFVAKEKKGFIASHNVFESIEDGKAETGYELTLDMNGKLDGQEDPRLAAKEMKGVIGLGNFLPDFEKGIAGMKMGETKTFDVNFPSNYFEASLAGKKAEFTVTLSGVAKPKYTTIEEVLKETDHTGHNHNNFEDEKSFEKYVEEYYDKETAKLIEDQWQKNVLQEVIAKSDKIPLAEDRISLEVDRIFGLIKADSEKQGRDIKEIFAISGVPGSEKKVKDEMEMKSIIEEYVRNEFKLSTLWNVIYEQKAENKVTPEQVDIASKEVIANPKKFGLPEKVEENQAKDFAANTLKKQIAAQWLFGTLKGEGKK